MKQKLYLSSYEYEDFSEVRTVVSYSWTFIEDSPVLVCQLDIPIEPDEYTPDISRTYTCFLANRFAKDDPNFVKLDHFPIEVHVLAARTSLAEDPSSFAQLSNLAWATLYDQRVDAQEHPELN